MSELRDYNETSSLLGVNETYYVRRGLPKKEASNTAFLCAPRSRPSGIILRDQSFGNLSPICRHSEVKEEVGVEEMANNLHRLTLSVTLTPPRRVNTEPDDVDNWKFISSPQPLIQKTEPVSPLAFSDALSTPPRLSIMSTPPRLKNMSTPPPPLDPVSTPPLLSPPKESQFPSRLPRKVPESRIGRRLENGLYVTAFGRVVMPPIIYAVNNLTRKN